jgi:hypothetical protein
MARKTHKDVEFAVDDASGQQHIFRTFDEAAGFAVALAVSDGRPHNIDVLVYSKAGARWWAGDEGAEEFEEDPEASVFERIVVRADSLGRVP